MRSTVRNLLTFVAVAALALTGAACAEDEDEAVDAGQVGADEITLEVADQTSNGAFVEIGSASAGDDEGLVAIHVDVNGEPGPVVGSQALDAGLNTDIEVPIDLPVGDDLQLWATLWADDGDGELDPESDEQLAGDDGELIARSFRVLPEVDADDAEDGDAEVDDPDDEEDAPGTEEPVDEES